MTKYSQPCDQVTRVRLPAALRDQIKATGAPASTLIRDAVVLYLAHPALKASNPSSDKKASAS